MRKSFDVNDSLVIMASNSEMSSKIFAQQHIHKSLKQNIFYVILFLLHF